MPRPLPLLARILNDAGLAAWFAASLRPRAGGEGVPSVRALAMVLHMAGAAYLTVDNRGRIVGQRGVFPAAALKAVLSVAAAVATVAAEARARRPDGHVAEDGPRVTPPDAAAVALTGATLVVNAVLGEQQRPREVVRALRLTPRRG